ncbi:MFS transporter [Companilactobacillus kimchii]|uniref:Multidrug transport protein n=2 Tax=Companilactobacillus kimchii TaxID=2801452 RepID=A0ABR5NRN7_9LACO|nr:MFS transporter [Companilactobacillus kimchii]GEO47567.1 MFS transporter [Companilactobacillus paralimentarius]KAE9559290.1 MFS transporter [Companilactobacillus kimchii]KAE9560813.1 MFS transporter [Companilactobacillus kimchii]KRK50676.1 multidrug transport protein [Companilactobacillus kimchii DSM 13961 = JCM 10707]OWF32433.1 Multidrug resistance protein MdtG [Companilactobacillus kimchii]
MQVTWKRNFRILWLGSLITGLGNAMTLPFIVLFIETLGDFNKVELNLLGAAAFSLTYLSKALVSPLWGKLADLKGRKLMCLRASGVMTFTILMVGLSPNVWFLLFFRAMQGAFSGYINNANALMSVSAPVEIRGRVMSKLITGDITGLLIGPLIGSFLATGVGYRGAFFVTSFLMAIVFLTTLFGVKEDFVPITKKELQPVLPIMKKIGWQFFLALFGSLLAVQATTNAITPMISLLVREIDPGSNNLVIITGVVSAAPGLATIVMAGLVGRLIDKLGALKSMLIFLTSAIICLILTSMVQNIWELVVLRFILGISDAALIPSIQVLTIQNVPNSIFGRIFSYNQSAQAMGNVLGPMLAAVIATGFGYKSIFLFSAVIEILALIAWLIYSKQRQFK